MELKIIDNYLVASCCSDQVKIKVWPGSEKSSPDLYIIKTPNASEDIDIADCFMEFLLLLNTLNDKRYKINRIKKISFQNMTIKPEFINIILSLCSIYDNCFGDYFKNKYIEFNNCYIPKEIKLGLLPCKDACIFMHCCTIEDFQSLNGFDGFYLYINKSTIKQYTGSVTMDCKEIEIDDTPLNYPYFFLNIILPNLEKIGIRRDKDFDDNELFFISFFPNLTSIEIPAVLEDTYCLDQLRNLEYVHGVRVYDKSTRQRQKDYIGGKKQISYSNNPEFYVDDEEFSIWNQRINDRNSDINDVRRHIQEFNENRLAPIKEAFEAGKSQPELFNIKYLYDIGAVSFTQTAPPFMSEEDYKNNIFYFDVDSLYNPRRKKSGLQFRIDRRKVGRGILRVDDIFPDIFPSISNNGLKISYNLGNSTIEGSIYGGDEEIVRETVKRLEKTMSKKEF